MVSNKPQKPTTPAIAGKFHNPYNFVPAFPRQGELGELGDRPPSGHDCYLNNHWSGRLTVKLKTITPLLIPDAAKAKELKGKNGHKTYPIREIGGQPYLPPTSIKGMLRSAYEAVTNSRLSILSGHEKPLGYRMDTKLGRQMVPARIEDDGKGGFRIQLLPGTSSINDDGTNDGALYAAWLPRYRNVVTYRDGSYPQHQQELEAWVEEVKHYRWNGKEHKYKYSFNYWRVREISLVGKQELSRSLQGDRDPAPPQARKSNSYHQRLGNLMKIRGFVCITRRNADNKHDERIFFSSQRPSPTSRVSFTISLDAKEQRELRKQWSDLITDYQEIHKDELEDSKPSTLNIRNGEWSRHIRTDDGEMAVDERTLASGTLCYAHVRKQGNKFIIQGLYPVTLSRGLFPSSPDELFQKMVHLQPAQKIEELSPADRIFGWVNQEGSGAYRGQLRIHSVKCQTQDAIAYFTEPEEDPQNNPGVPLAILGQPKPQQVRFYLSRKNADGKNKGEPLPDKTSKKEGYQNGQGLRGRKVYPHHKQLDPKKVDDYWEKPGDNPDIQYGNNLYREYRRPPGEKQRDSQNRSIQAWVKPGTEFEFEIDVINLSDEELGALVWLLQLEDGHYHRLGGGKPLGFGSVQLSMSHNDLKQGQEWGDYYRSLHSLSQAASEKASECVQKFEQAVAKAYGYQNPVDIPFIKAFLQAARGFDDTLPIHYPRITPDPKPEGEGFDWFMDNEREKGSKRSLPPLWDDKGLPYTP